MPSKLVGLFRKLTWADFQGTPPGGPFAALTASKFTITPTPFPFVASGSKFELDDNVTVTVVFNQKNSWKIADLDTWPSNLQDELLDHEQGHYDITALVARDYFIKLMNQKGRTFASAKDGINDLNWWTNLYITNLNKIQTAYDGETGHSQANVFVPSTNMFTPPHQKGGPQVKWERLIASAFTTVRISGELAPDGTPYKMELMDILKNASINP
jgi:hypothetical protein